MGKRQATDKWGELVLEQLQWLLAYEAVKNREHPNDCITCATGKCRGHQCKKCISQSIRNWLNAPIKQKAVLKEKRKGGKGHTS